MSSKRADGYSKQEQIQQEQSVHGEAANEQGRHSGEGAASAMAHMIQQDQKHRREGHRDSGDAEEDATQG